MDRAVNQQLRRWEAYEGGVTELQPKSCLPRFPPLWGTQEVKGGGGLLPPGHILLVVYLPLVRLFQGEAPALPWQAS